MLPAVIGAQTWWLYVPKGLWEAYLAFAQKQGYKRGEGVFQQAMCSLPISMGGTGRLVNMLPPEEKKVIWL